MKVSPALEAEILMYYRVEKWPVGTIATQLHLHRDTVARILARAGVSQTGLARTSAIDQYLPFIHETLGKFPALSSSRLYVMVKNRGYIGGADHFRRLMSLHRPPSERHRHPVKDQTAVLDEGESTDKRSKRDFQGFEAEILMYYQVEKWRVGTIATQLHLHRDTVARILAHAGVPKTGLVRTSAIDQYLPFIRETLGKFPDLSSSRLYVMVKNRGYIGGADHFRHLLSLHRPPSERYRHQVKAKVKEPTAALGGGEPTKQPFSRKDTATSTQTKASRPASSSTYTLRIESGHSPTSPMANTPPCLAFSDAPETLSDHRPHWPLEFTLLGRHSLEQLSEIILQLLGLEGEHLYEFKIADRTHAHLVRWNEDKLFVETAAQCVSCNIPIRLLGLSVGETIALTYHFGRPLFLQITVLNIRPVSTANVVRAEGSFQEESALEGIVRHATSCATELTTRTEASDIISASRKLDPFRIRFIRELDRSLLVQWRASNNKTDWQKAVTILESRNLSPTHIAAKIELTKEHVEKWINAFNRFGLEGLKRPDGHRGPTKSHERERRAAVRDQKARRILEIVHAKPNAYGINRSNWTRPSIARAYEQEYKATISVRYVGQLLKKFGYAIRKARKVLTSPDPNYREKVELLLTTLQNLKPGQLFFFVDELGPLRVKKYGGRALVRKNEVLTYPQEQAHRGVIMMSGALSATTNQVTWVYGRAKDTAAMIDLMELLYNQYFSASKLYVTWDAASWHKSAMLIEWLDAFNSTTKKTNEGPLIELVPLPTSSQFLDVIEAVFSGMKRAVVHHSDYSDVPEMKNAISRHFGERNAHFRANPRRAGKQIWEIDFFDDNENMRSGNYREW